MLTETEKKLARDSGYSHRMIELIVQGIKRPHPKKAKVLERITGVPRLAWIYPDEFDNPYIRKEGK